MRFMSRDGGLFVVEFLSDGLQVPPSRIVAQSLHMRCASVLWNYRVSKAQSGYVSSNEDPRLRRPKKSNFIASYENVMVTIE
ncbi:hypothetical protein H5410_040548 [Solanum commersonii]|uniref:Uncharacterized protein n=1 Tax=Solanum commersonii TaxID=4109 RepID=A0A9J5XQG2_SOLCO|nr:hypothetical protein H5410_040548 [Solanum commersonii]